MNPKIVKPGPVGSDLVRLFSDFTFRATSMARSVSRTEFRQVAVLVSRAFMIFTCERDAELFFIDEFHTLTLAKCFGERVFL